MAYTIADTSYMPSNYSLPGSAGFGSNAYGSIPNLPNPVSTASGAVAGAMNTGNQVYNQLPGYQSSLANIGANVNAETAGVLPPDVIRQLQQGAAERGVATGTAGSPNQDASYLRALGLTSLDLTRMGQQGLNTQLGMLPGAGIYQNPAFYPTSGQQQEVSSANAIYRSAPDPQAAAQAAMQAARSGLATGRGAVGGFGGGGGGTGTSDFWNTGAPGGTMTAYGSGENATGAISQFAPQAAYDEILNTYAPTVQGGGFNWGDETQSIPSGGGDSSGYYYAGDAGGGGDNFLDEYNSIYGT